MMAEVEKFRRLSAALNEAEDEEQCAAEARISARLAVWHGARMLRDSLPEEIWEMLWPQPVGAADEMRAFYTRVRDLAPVIDPEGRGTFVDRILVALLEQTAGGESEYFGPSRFQGFGNRNPLSIAQLRFEALALYDAGRRASEPAAKLQGALTAAFATSFDSIRKWDKYCCRVFGVETLNFTDQMWHTMFEHSPEHAYKAINEVGDEYRKVWSKSRK